MIPRLLHHIWVGPEPVPTSLIEPWLEMHPGWDHVLWREDELRSFGLVNQRAFEAYLKGRRWHGAANVARYEVLARLGGVYVDMDTRPLRPFDKGPFMRDDVELFAGYVQPREARPGLIGNAYIGAITEHPILVDAIARIGKLAHLVPPFKTTGVYLFTDVVEAHGDDEHVRIMPTHTLFPHDKVGAEAPKGRGATYAEHLWGSTRVSPWKYPRA
jgi:mannosyltransferase OCH1-like enzyme